MEKQQPNLDSNLCLKMLFSRTRDSRSDVQRQTICRQKTSGKLLTLSEKKKILNALATLSTDYQDPKPEKQR